MAIYSAMLHHHFTDLPTEDIGFSAFHSQQHSSKTGWWFGCHEFYFPRNIGNNHHPNWRTPSFFRGVQPQPPTRKYLPPLHRQLLVNVLRQKLIGNLLPGAEVTLQPWLRPSMTEFQFPKSLFDRCWLRHGGRVLVKVSFDPIQFKMMISIANTYIYIAKNI